MRQNPIESNNGKSLLRLRTGIRIAGLSPVAALALGTAISLSPGTAHALEYPWCVSREGYLYYFYTTTCNLSPRVLAAVFKARKKDSATLGLGGGASTPIMVDVGINSRSSSSRFGPTSTLRSVMPVRLSPGGGSGLRQDRSRRGRSPARRRLEWLP
jgi:hypothetical protein